MWYKHIQWYDLLLPLAAVWTILHDDFLKALLLSWQETYSECHGTSKRWKQDSTGPVVHLSEYRVPSMILLRCGCTHSHFENLWMFISKLHSGSDYCGERHEKLWQRKVKHQLFLFCTELSFQKKGYGFLVLVGWEFNEENMFILSLIKLSYWACRSGFGAVSLRHALALERVRALFMGPCPLQPYKAWLDASLSTAIIIWTQGVPISSFFGCCQHMLNCFFPSLNTQLWMILSLGKELLKAKQMKCFF